MANTVHAQAGPQASDPFDLSGRIALVTGSTRGIGAGIAQALSSAGATVIVHGRDHARVAAAVDDLRRLPTRTGRALVEGAAFDVTDHDAMRTSIRDLEAQTGGIDILVNNAGTNSPADLVDLPPTTWNTIVSTNLTACFLLAQQLAPGMINRRRGKIINICSVHNRLVRGRVGAYAAAKAGLAALTQVMCASWAASGVQANGLAPGFIETEMTAKLRDDPEFDRWMRTRTPAGRWGTPADLGGTAVWLASSASDFVNGQIIFVDGGITAVL